MGTSGQLAAEKATSPNHNRRRRRRTSTGIFRRGVLVVTTSLLLGPCCSYLPRTMIAGAFTSPVRRLCPHIAHMCGRQVRPGRSVMTTTRTSPLTLLFSTDASSASITATGTKNNLWEEEFVVEVPEGLCVGLILNDMSSLPPSATDRCLEPTTIAGDSNHWIRKLLHPMEVDYGLQLSSEKNRMSFFVGRLAMRYALMTASSCYPGGISEMVSTREICEVPQDAPTNGVMAEDVPIWPIVSTQDPCILKDEYGRPIVPKGFLGSISHKDNIGVALVAEDGGDDTPLITKGIGIDIEKASALKTRIERKILTPNERENLGHIEGISRDEEVLLRFSLKESVYKAMHPLINQYVGFQEAEITPRSDGTALVNLNLKSGEHTKLGTITANWRRVLDDQYFLSSSSVTLAI